MPLPDANGNLQTIDPATGHSDLPILVTTDATGTATVTDFAYTVTDSGTTYWKLASGNNVTDASGNVIAEPTLAQVMAQTPSSGTWQTFTADEIGFIERYTGQPLPIDQATSNPAGALTAMTPIITSAWNAMNLDAVELAMQGPLAGYFQGLAYDAASDTFSPTTDEQLAPMYEAIFQAAPTDPTGAATWLAQWKPIVDVVLSNLDRGQDLAVSYAYVFASMVHAYETVGYPLDIVATATALGVPSDMVIAGGSTLTGNGSPDIYYLNAGNQTVNASAGDDPVINDFGYRSPHGTLTLRQVIVPCRQAAKHQTASASAGALPVLRHRKFGRASLQRATRKLSTTRPRALAHFGADYSALHRLRSIPHSWYQPRHSIFICIPGCSRLASQCRYVGGNGNGG